MKNNKLFKILPLALVGIALFLVAFNNYQQEEFDPVAIYLTWQYDPTTTMTIDWHTTPEDGNRESIVQYRELGGSNWSETAGNFQNFPHSDRIIHRVELRRLKPATTYEFRFGEDSREFRFRTMPEDLSSEPVRFVTGGDTSHEDHGMTARAMQYDPDFILWGGDLAYANGDPARVDYWYGWFDGIKENLIDEDGKVIPVVVAIGNHELFGERRLRDLPEEEAEAYMLEHNLWDDKPTYFFELFAFPGRPSYNVLDFGDYMSIIALDSDHYSSVSGGQTGWLEAILAERVGRPHIFPIYHWPAYPSHRNFDGNVPTRIRENWVPLFEQYGVEVVFENHDHTYKRTHPIRNGQISEDGIVYIGDGNWGRSAREGANRDEWYIKEFASVQNGIVVTLDGNTQEYLMVDPDGNIIDSYSISNIIP